MSTEGTDGAPTAQAASPQPGDTVRGKPVVLVPPEALRIGDKVVFRRCDHRIVADEGGKGVVWVLSDHSLRCFLGYPSVPIRPRGRAEGAAVEDGPKAGEL